MNIDGLLQNLEDDAKNEQEQVQRKLDVQTEQILSNARRRIDLSKNEKLAQTKEKLDIEEAQKLSDAKLQSNRRILEAKQKTLQEIYGEARNGLARIAQSSEYQELLKALIQESIQGFTEKCIIYAAPQDAARVKSLVSKMKVSATVEASDRIQSGIIAKSLDGKLTVINTLDSRLARAIDTLDTQIVNILWSN